ncbi:MAG: pseudouridine synthase [Schleiferiaceae bacterium]|nr:pseudouridine synthase [Schleiferiaceae bacterium]
MRSNNKRNSDSSQRRDGAGKRFSKSDQPRGGSTSRDGKSAPRQQRDTDGQKSNFTPRGTKSYGDRQPQRSSDSKPRFHAGKSDAYPKRDAPRGEKKEPYAPRPRAEFDKAKRSEGREPDASGFNDRKPRGRSNSFGNQQTGARNTFSRGNSSAFSRGNTGTRPNEEGRRDQEAPRDGKRKPFERPFGYRPSVAPKKDKFATREVKETTRLNKYLAQAGICSRREADELIKTGLVSINDEIVVEMGYQVKPTDTVKYNGQTLRGEKTKYLLLNKPKGFITTTDDPKARKTVMELVAKACKERIYPVGRLDRATTGLLLFTNDGDMAKKLTHPSHGAKKIYHVVLDKKLDDKDLAFIKKGFELEDGPVVVDKINYVEDKDKSHVGLEIHIGRNRIVRRIFAHLGYEVVKLDRIAFAGLTKKKLPRGTWRFLSPKEVSFLRML